MKKAVIYTRCRAPLEGYDTHEWQIEKLKKYSKEKDLTILAIFSDSCSAIETFKQGLGNMIAYIDSNEGIDTLLITSWDRLSRNSLQAIHLKQKFKKKGITVVCPYSISTNNNIKINRQLMEELQK